MCVNYTRAKLSFKAQCWIQVPLHVHYLVHRQYWHVAYNSYRGAGISITTATRYVPGFKLAWGERDFLFSIWVQSVHGPTQPPVRWVLRIFPGEGGMKRSGCCADHPPLFSSQNKYAYSYTSTLPRVSSVTYYEETFTFIVLKTEIVFLKAP
jgi:hypothetical protein